jgi:hypothetical protein
MHRELAHSKNARKDFLFKIEAATLKQQLQNITDTVHAGRQGPLPK